MGQENNQSRYVRRRIFLPSIAMGLLLTSCGLSSSVAPVAKDEFSTTTTLPVIVLPSAINPPQQGTPVSSSSQIAPPSQTTLAPSAPPVTAAQSDANTVSAASLGQPTTTSPAITSSITTSSTTTQPISSATTQVTQASSLPTLGLSSAYVGGVGFGSIEPATISLGGDPTGVISAVAWSSWGDSTATGSGIAAYVAPGQATATAMKQSATVVAFNLGDCNGEMVYRDILWYFPQYGQSESDAHAIPTCPIN